MVPPGARVLDGNPIINRLAVFCSLVLVTGGVVLARNRSLKCTSSMAILYWESSPAFVREHRSAQMATCAERPTMETRILSVIRLATVS